MKIALPDGWYCLRGDPSRNDGKWMNPSTGELKYLHVGIYNGVVVNLTPENTADKLPNDVAQRSVNSELYSQWNSIIKKSFSGGVATVAADLENTIKVAALDCAGPDGWYQIDNPNREDGLWLKGKSSLRRCVVGVKNGRITDAYFKLSTSKPPLQKPMNFKPAILDLYKILGVEHLGKLPRKYLGDGNITIYPSGAPEESEESLGLGATAGLVSALVFGTAAIKHILKRKQVRVAKKVEHVRQTHNS